MTGFSQALQDIGNREVRAVIELASAEAQAIAASSIAHVREELEGRRSARAAELLERESAARMEARSGARRSALGARQALVDRVMEAAHGLLPEASTPEWLKGEVERVLRYLPEGKARLRSAPRDLAAVRRFVADREETAVAADGGIAAGVIAEMADGSLVVDGTLASRLERMRGALAIEIVAALERSP